MKRTPWFSAGKKPARPGVYEVQIGFCDNWFKHWDGKRWSVGYGEPGLAFLGRRERTETVVLRWRGLTTKDGK